MKAKEGEEQSFEKAWGDVTDAIREHRNSLGSRLHRTEQKNVYMAYAQWPDKQTCESDAGIDLYATEQMHAVKRLRESTEHIKVIYTATVFDDRPVS